LESNAIRIWTSNHDAAFSKLKDEVSLSRVLAHYDLNAATKISADISHGLGAVLLQQQDNCEWKPVAFVSRSLSDTESHYVQIETEALAPVWSCEKYADYVMSKPFLFETDHKPLVTLLGNKRLSTKSPPFLFMTNEYSITHVPGKTLYMALMADTL